MSASTSPPAYTLTYFDARGLAEVTRYLFAITETPYQDKRLPLHFKVPGDFSTIVKEEFDTAKNKGEFRVGMDRVPVLDADGVRLAQSKAIERFVARRVGCLGKDDVEAAQIDIVTEHVRDIKQAYQKVRGVEDADEKSKATDAWFSTDLADYSRKLEAVVASTVARHERINLAHVTLYYFYHFFFDRSDEARKTIAHCPNITAYCARIAQNPRVQHWENVRNKTDL